MKIFGSKQQSAARTVAPPAPAIVSPGAPARTTGSAPCTSRTGRWLSRAARGLKLGVLTHQILLEEGRRQHAIVDRQPRGAATIPRLAGGLVDLRALTERSVRIERLGGDVGRVDLERERIDSATQVDAHRRVVLVRHGTGVRGTPDGPAPRAPVLDSLRRVGAGDDGRAAADDADVGERQLAVVDVRRPAHGVVVHHRVALGGGGRGDRARGGLRALGVGHPEVVELPFAPADREDVGVVEAALGEVLLRDERRRDRVADRPRRVVAEVGANPRADKVLGAPRVAQVDLVLRPAVGERRRRRDERGSLANGHSAASSSAPPCRATRRSGSTASAFFTPLAASGAVSRPSKHGVSSWAERPRRRVAAAAAAARQHKVVPLRGPQLPRLLGAAPNTLVAVEIQPGVREAAGGEALRLQHDVPVLVLVGDALETVGARLSSPSSIAPCICSGTAERPVASEPCASS